ncbi:MAG: hypothetical protein P8Y00_08940, partial [Deltaproteobacteria bacterium]
KNRIWEIPLLLSVTVVLMRPDAVAGWLGVSQGERYWMYPIGLALFGLVYLLQRPRAARASVQAKA